MISRISDPENRSGEKVGGAGDERVHRVAEGMVEVDPALGDPARAQRRDVGLTELVQHGGADQAERPADAAEERADERQDDVIEIGEGEPERVARRSSPWGTR